MRKINPKILVFMMFLLSIVITGMVSVNEIISPPSGGLAPGGEGTGGGG